MLKTQMCGWLFKARSRLSTHMNKYGKKNCKDIGQEPTVPFYLVHNTGMLGDLMAPHRRGDSSIRGAGQGIFGRGVGRGDARFGEMAGFRGA